MKISIIFVMYLNFYGIPNIYNGRISSRKTREGRYDYGYDGNGRLASAVFSDSGVADYSTEYGYDSNGNLTSMVRAGVVDRAGTDKIYGALDVLDVSLEGNRAVRYDIESDGDVFEGRTGFGGRNDSYDIEYDANGNVVFDGSVACAYVYNRLNQSVSIETEDGTMTLDYDGAGTLLSRTVESGGVTTKTEYLGPYELVDGELRAAYFDGGYFDADGKAHYYIPDYQGNIVADVTAAGKVVQKASYYPYGEPWLEPEGDNRRLYGGKERLNFGALHHSDYGPRLLDTRSGRWKSPDPCAEEFYPYSPYSVCGGDPINYVDRDGRRFTAASMPAVNKMLDEAFKGFLSSKVYAIDYARAFAEIMIMQVSDQLFHVSAISPLGNIGGTVYDSGMDAVVFKIPGGVYGGLGLIAHEFKHGYQFLTGEMDLGIKGIESHGYLFYEQTDEREAYDRGHLFGADYFSDEYIATHYNYLNNYKANSSLILRNGILTDKLKDKFNMISDQFGRIFIINGTIFRPITK